MRETTLGLRVVYAAPARKEVPAAFELGAGGEFENVLVDDASSVYRFDLDLGMYGAVQ
jgi:hypothetical protein